MSQIVRNSFDVFGYADVLQKAGFTQDQAKILAQAQSATPDNLIASKQLATKADIFGLKAEMGEIKALIQQTGNETLKWVFAMHVVFSVGFIGVILAILKN